METSAMGKYRCSGVFVKLPRATLEEIDSLVEKGIFLNRTHLVRRAVEEFLMRRHPAKDKAPPPPGGGEGGVEGGH